jgi:hypothetical protein
MRKDISAALAALLFDFLITLAIDTSGPANQTNLPQATEPAVATC